MEELKNQIALQNEELQQQIREQIRIQQEIEYMEELAKKYMEPEAIKRYGNLKLAHPEKALQVIALIVQAIQTGKLNKKITDAEFKDILIRMEPKRKKFKIVRK